MYLVGTILIQAALISSKKGLSMTDIKIMLVSESYYNFLHVKSGVVSPQTHRVPH